MLHYKIFVILYFISVAKTQRIDSQSHARKLTVWQ